jgi:hypothetical protein
MDNLKEVNSTSGRGRSRHIQHIMQEQGIEEKDVIVIGAGDADSVDRILELMTNGVPKGKVLIVEDIDKLVHGASTLGEVIDGLDSDRIVKLKPYHLDDRDNIKNMPYKSDQPFAKFRGNKNKWQR